MGDIIKLLPDSVANQIAAGEVIQRPASVVKELVENSVDAGADIIKIIIKDAGRTLIQVVDNGCGMSPADARLAFERHSTSKISDASDLFSLRTMGFRGEALASIAAISQVDLRTMPHDGSVGSRIQLSASKVVSQEPEACAAGSNLMVKNLFFNVPARRKFLKKDSVELSNIIHEFERLALVNCDVEFLLMHNDVVLHQLMKGTLKQRIIDLFGKSLDKQLIPVRTKTAIVEINGFVGLPENARKRGALQYFCVNGRNMRHPYFHKAVLQCYNRLIPVDEQPGYFLNFTVAPETIDVNIHPTKNESKFENEPAIWQILVAAVRESLGKANAVPSIEFDAADAPRIPVFNPNANASHDIVLDRSYDPFDSRSPQSGPGAWQRSAGQVTRDWEKLYRSFQQDGAPGRSALARGSVRTTISPEQEQGLGADREAAKLDLSPDTPAVSTMQLKNRYILSPAKSGLMLIDQHRAHVRILYEEYLRVSRTGQMNTQRVMFPEVLQLTAAQDEIMKSVADKVDSLGFDLSFIGDRCWSINGVPSAFKDINAKEVLLRMIENAIETGEDLSSELKEKVALSMARAAAVGYGQQLTQSDMEQLVSDLFKLPAPNYTPDGKTIINIISIEDIAKLFG